MAAVEADDKTRDSVKIQGAKRYMAEADARNKAEAKIK